MFSGVGIALPALGRELQAGGVMLGLVETVYIGAAASVLLPFGKLADITCRKCIFKTGAVIFALTTLLLGFSGNIWQILFLRLIQGSSAAMVTSTNMAILAESVEKDKLGRAIGLSVGSVYAGLSAGPFFAGIITNHLSWRWVFFISAMILLLVLIPIFKILKSEFKFKGAMIDIKGSLTIITAIALIVSGSSILSSSHIGFVLIVIGLLFFGLFFYVENRVKEPLLDISLVTENKRFLRALTVQLLNYASTFGIQFLFSIFLQVSKGIPPQHAGRVMMIPPVIMAVFAPFFGRLSDRYPAHKLAGTGLAFCLGAVITATFVDMHTPMTLIYFLFALLGFGFAMFSSPNMNIIMSSVEKKNLSIASALSAKMRTLGMVFSMVFVTIFISIFIGKHQINADTVMQYQSVMTWSFIVFAITGAIGLFLAFRK